MLLATVLALGSACVHAAWNLLIKTSTDRRTAGWGQFLLGGVLALPVVAIAGPPGLDSLPWLLLSGGVHILYLEGLARAYTHGDFSLSYPLARGGGALLAGLGGVVLLGDHLPGLAWAALGVVAFGVLSLTDSADWFARLVRRPCGFAATSAVLDGRPRLPARPLRGRGRGGPDGVTWAAFTAGTIATYTLIDAHGSRLASSGVSYGVALMPIAAVLVSTANVAAGRLPALRAGLPRNWRRWAVGGACTTLAYTLVMVAVRLAPVGYVTTLRESSVVLGALAGWLVLREGLGARRLASSMVILSGLVLLVASSG